jgi:penicillin V acylase-like amidase (Ntn superfamily)
MCTRVVYMGADGLVVTARSMDWMGPVHSDLWAFPSGLKRNGAAGPNAIEWTSKYGSVVTAAFDVASADGMNERGLVANLLYLGESQYAKPATADRRRPLAITAWVQYVLDTYASVAEAVDDLRKESFYVATMMTPDGHPGQLHLSISDATGDSAIFEYLDGKLVIHHGRQYQVMTNSPVFDQHLALDAYWQTVGGHAMLPGTSRPADRFVRMSYYVGDVKKTADPVEAVATAFSLIRNASVPLGVKPPPGAPNVAETLWRTVSDHKNRLYFFESTRSPNVFWTALADLDFSAGAPARKLKLTDGAVFAGNAAAQFEKAEPFKFLAADVK